MHKSRTPWFMAGLITIVVAFFLSHAGGLGIVQRIVSPDYVSAQRGIQVLEARKTLEPADPGFSQLAALFVERYRERNLERDTAGIEATRLERQSAVISVDEKNAPEVVPITCLLADGQKIEWDQVGLAKAINQYRSHAVFFVALALLAIGLLITYIVFVLERRRAAKPTDTEVPENGE